MTNPNEPAMPIQYHYKGLTKREYMATKIMAAYIAGSGVGISCGAELDHKYYAKEAVNATDALINQLNKQS